VVELSLDLSSMRDRFDGRYFHYAVAEWRKPGGLCIEREDAIHAASTLLGVGD
jgi:hypothetical protein